MFACDAAPPPTPQFCQQATTLAVTLNLPPGQQLHSSINSNSHRHARHDTTVLSVASASLV